MRLYENEIVKQHPENVKGTCWVQSFWPFILSTDLNRPPKAKIIMVVVGMPFIIIMVKDRDFWSSCDQIFRIITNSDHVPVIFRITDL
mmetsp:Transcript_7617/g.14823  ORF Transcript_7617/g.14823 Transcript_7617/m.14823 type:complete len:88 (-) Transcript_7617:53-316(-)